MENRIIKFRAWHRQLGVMLNVYVISQSTDVNGFTQTCKGWYGDNNQVAFPYDQADWLQFTGLYDKNGKEIFEGDIVRFANGNIGEVVFDKMAALVDDSVVDFMCYCIRHGKSILCLEGTDEVIGNVYENAEILA